jgi:hypothetical protein
MFRNGQVIMFCLYHLLFDYPVHDQDMQLFILLMVAYIIVYKRCLFTNYFSR